METATFEAFRTIVYDRSGITISANKVSLMAARVGKRMRELGIAEHAEYLDMVQCDNADEEIVHLLDVVSTNVTSFYREANHFEFLGNLLDEWVKKGRRKFRIWCAAASTGEEPYTLAITLREHTSIMDADVRLLATDLSTRVLARAKAGVYRADKTESIPPRLRDRYFLRRQQGTTIDYEANVDLKKIVSFDRLNLAKPPFPMSGPFDAIFCRNVMIYFDNAVRSRLLQECHRLLKPDGYLFVGHAESLTGISTGFKAVEPSVYVKG